MMGMHGNADWWNIGMLFMGVFWVALLAVAVWVVVRLTRRADEPARDGSESPPQILDRRFASGEIDEDEFRRRRELLHSTSGSRR